MTNNLKNMPIFQIAYALIMSYIPILDKNNINSEYNLVSDLPLNEIPLYNVVYNYHIRNFLSKKEFQKIHKNILHMQSENFIYFQIPKEFYEIFQKGDYWDFLNYNIQPYVQKIKTFYANNDKLTVTIEGIKILKEIF